MTLSDISRNDRNYCTLSSNSIITYNSIFKYCKIISEFYKNHPKESWKANTTLVVQGKFMPEISKSMFAISEPDSRIAIKSGLGLYGVSHIFIQDMQDVSCEKLSIKDLEDDYMYELQEELSYIISKNDDGYDNGFIPLF